MNGYGSVSLEAFIKMQRCSVKPYEQTFMGVLAACSYSMMVEERCNFFNMMASEYRLSPNVRHYGCVVDLLGCVGLLDEAYRFIMKMNVKSDFIIWRTLGACRIAQEAGDYVLLLNIYASAGNREKAVESRELMKDKEIQTSPCCNTMELRGVVYEFVSGDTLSTRKTEILKMLDEIRSQLKLHVYIACVESELHYLEDEKKVVALSYHSEKLAIAFAVLATPSGTTIRIANNFLKFFFKCFTIVNRKVIIRDRGRFHHF